MLNAQLFIGTCAVLAHRTFAVTNYNLDKECNQRISMPFYQQSRIQLSSTYLPGKTCQLTFYTDTPDKFMVYFRDLSIPSSSICTNNWLEVHDGGSRGSSTLTPSSKQCGYSSPSTVYNTTGNYVTFYLQTDYTGGSVSLDIIVTPYNDGVCSAGEFHCSNGRCIDNSLTCSGYNPCGDHSDCDVITINVGGIAGAVVGGIVFVIFIICIVLVVRRHQAMYVRIPMAVSTTTVATGGPPPHGYNNPGYGTAQPAGAVYPQTPGS